MYRLSLRDRFVILDLRGLIKFTSLVCCGVLHKIIDHLEAHLFELSAHSGFYQLPGQRAAKQCVANFSLRSKLSIKLLKATDRRCAALRMPDDLRIRLHRFDAPLLDIQHKIACGQRTDPVGDDDNRLASSKPSDFVDDFPLVVDV